MYSFAGLVSMVVFFFLFAPAAAGSPPMPSSQIRPGGSDGDDPSRPVERCRMDKVGELCRHWLAAALGMRITLPVRFSWEPLETIKREAGPNAAGYTSFAIDGPEVTPTIHAPYGQRFDHTVHVVTHELTHVWEYEQEIRNDHELTEGVSEWAAWHHLQTLGYADEQRVIEGNVLDGYGSGFHRIQNLSDRYGLTATVAHVIRLARASRATLRRIEGLAASPAR